MIQIVRGVYGHLDQFGIVRPKTAESAPFSLSPEQEERLVRIGVAKYVGHAAVTLPEEPAAEEAQALSELSVKELRELGKDYGLSFKVGISKAEMVSAIEEAQAELDAVPEDGESAPVFDASEAVQ